MAGDCRVVVTELAAVPGEVAVGLLAGAVGEGAVVEVTVVEEV
jgi:hypothetical protein